MKKRKVLALGFAALLLWGAVGCAPAVVIRPNASETYQDADQVICAANCSTLGEEEQQIVRQSVYELLSYLQARFGKEPYHRLLKTIVAGTKPSLAVLDVYGKSLYRIGVSMLRDLTAAAEPAGPWRSEVCGSYTLHYQTGSPAERDLTHIQYLLRQYDRQLQEIWASSAEHETRWRESVAALEGQTINIWLAGDAASVRQLFRGSYSTAETQIGYHCAAPGQPFYLQAGMCFKYQGLITLHVLFHEMTHIWQMLARMPPEVLHPQIAPGEEARGQLQKLIEKINSLGGGWLGEGMAEYLSGNGSVLRQAGLFADVDEEIRRQLPKGGLKVKLEDLERKIHSADDRERVLAYQLAHSICRQLVSAYGWEPVLRLLATPGRAVDYQNQLGQSLRQIQAQWQKRVFGAEE